MRAAAIGAHRIPFSRGVTVSPESIRCCQDMDVMKRPTARILLADDHEIVRRGVRALLSDHPNWEICAEAADGLSALEAARESRPDVAILDISMPRMNGLEALERMRRALPGIAVIMLSVHDDEHLISRAIVAGAVACLSKLDGSRHIVPAVEAAVAKRRYFTTNVSDMMLDRVLSAAEPRGMLAEDRKLTSREREIVQLLAEGLSNKAIATALNLAVPTVQTYRTTIMRKLGVGSVADIVRYAVRNKIIEA
jgi:DNA-binding NarL/FixJ family response regulator